MKRARLTEEQINAVLKEHEAGAKTADLARKHGISEATFYNWKAKYGGMDVSEATRLKALEHENAKLAEQMLDSAALRELLSKNGSRQARCGAHLRAVMGLSERWAADCLAAGASFAHGKPFLPIKWMRLIPDGSASRRSRMNSRR
jgi:putative transposase